MLIHLKKWWHQTKFPFFLAAKPPLGHFWMQELLLWGSFRASSKHQAKYYCRLMLDVQYMCWSLEQWVVLYCRVSGDGSDQPFPAPDSLLRERCWDISQLSPVTTKQISQIWDGMDTSSSDPEHGIALTMGFNLPKQETQKTLKSLDNSLFHAFACNIRSENICRSRSWHQLMCLSNDLIFPLLYPSIYLL